MRVQKDEDRINYLWNKYSQTSSQLDEIALLMATEDMEEKQVENEHDSELELIQENTEYGFVLKKKEKTSAEEIIQKLSQT